MRRSVTSGFVLGCVMLAVPVLAGSPGPPRVSLDQTVSWNGVVLADEHLGEQDPLSGTVTRVELGLLPPAVDLTGYHHFDGGGALVAVDVTAILGGVTVEPRDVARLVGAVVTLELDGSDLGVPDGARVDAVSWVGDGVVVSFDQAVRLPGPLTVEDEDLVLLGPGGPTVLFDGSAAGLDSVLDVDAAHLDPDTGEVLVSLDGAGQVGAVAFDHGDVLGWRSDLGAWRFALAAAADWGLADLDALYYPSSTPETPLFADDFETGSTGRWSATVP